MWPTALHCPAVGRPRVDGPLSHTPPGEGRSEERRREGGGGEETLYYLLPTNTEGKLAVSKRPHESDKTSKFSTTRDMQSIQALCVASTVISLCPHTPTYTMLYALVQEPDVCILFKAHLDHAWYSVICITERKSM